ncbi:UNC93-like protein MFSD11 isoform X1 [Hippocampus comes]|uniref:UNC93-like protein MFSD11 isoform X1 n=1 Tax=Hippocampus comes TaxID=109280 RepID=UPI00094E2363|nr:PREDICTED: UNC93-like protein MFSD11 isoform X1 [Hippocampus comes]XP_019722078.1 PREDICTED: UNC93-like protein MFSD11 isoform X1 [Hippocampus comes]
MGPDGKKLVNVIVLGVAFMFIFTAFQTCGNIEQTVIKSLNSTTFHASGYTSMAVIYGVFSASNLLAPSVVAVAGAQLSMFFSGLLYSAYIAVFVYPYTWSFYTASVLVGAGAAVLWTAQGNVLALNSDQHTIGRNSGVFWALLQCSLLFGNLFIFFAWRGHEHISDKDRQTVFISLTVISLVGCFLFFLIRKPDAEAEIAPGDESEAPLLPSDSGESALGSPLSHVCSQALDAFVRACKMLVTKEMLLLSLSIAYTGVELTFYSGVYGTCIGAMTGLGADAKSLMGLSGICVGLGEILGGGVFGVLNKGGRGRVGRNPVVLLGLLSHYVAFYLIFINIADDAPLAPEEGTELTAFIRPRLPPTRNATPHTNVWAWRCCAASCWAWATAASTRSCSASSASPSATTAPPPSPSSSSYSPSWRRWPSSTATSCCCTGSSSSWSCWDSPARSPSLPLSGGRRQPRQMASDEDDDPLHTLRSPPNPHIHFKDARKHDGKCRWWLARVDFIFLPEIRRENRD